MVTTPGPLQRLVRRDEFDPFVGSGAQCPCFDFEDKPPFGKGLDLGIAIVGAVRGDARK
jgi:hypothetical protein